MIVPVGGVPPFDDEGLLAPGVYDVTLGQLAASALVGGYGSPTWDSAWRGYLVRNLGVLVRQLWQVGIPEVYIDGSFVEDKDRPNDIDGYFPCDMALLASGRLEEQLNRIDPAANWTWSGARRRWDERSRKAQLPMWFAYHVELYPHVGQGTGVFDADGHELLFPSLFRRSRAGDREKGIVRVVRAEGAS